MCMVPLILVFTFLAKFGSRIFSLSVVGKQWKQKQKLSEWIHFTFLQEVTGTILGLNNIKEQEDKKKNNKPVK